MELAIFGGDVPRDRLETLAGDALLAIDEQDAPDDPRERRRRFARTWEVAAASSSARPSAAESGGGLPELVIDSPAGAFGTGAHPTTRMCLELLVDLEPAGGFADLGCGAGLLAIAAAALGYRPVFAVDHESRSVEATRAQRGAQRGGGRGAPARPARGRRRRPRRPSPPTSRRRSTARSPGGSRRPSSTSSRPESASRDVEEVLAVYGAAGFDPIDERGGALAGRAAGARAGDAPLDPAAATAAPHGQLASALPDGGLARLLPQARRGRRAHADPARARAVPARRAAGRGHAAGHARGRCTARRPAGAPRRRRSPTTARPTEPAVVGFAFVVDAEPHPLAGRISLASTIDRESGVTHFVAHAVVREVTVRLTILTGVDREDIERHDFPVGRRGYDPAAVRRAPAPRRRRDRRAAREPRLPSGADAAVGGHVRAGARDPRGRRDRRRRAARRGRSRGGRARRARGGGRRRDALEARPAREPSSTTLLEALRRSGEQLNDGLARLQEQVSDFGGDEPGPSAASPRPPRPSPSRSPQAEPSRVNGDEAGARLIALNMALSGTPARARPPPTSPSTTTSPTPRRCSTTCTRRSASERRADRAPPPPRPRSATSARSPACCSGTSRR